jgi:iron complex transport system substrate-binding protein
MMKRIMLLTLAAIMLLSLLAACGGTKTAEPKATEPAKTAETVLFKDSAGREVQIPADITRVAPSGTVATMFLAAVCPEYLVCIGSEPSAAQTAYLPQVTLTLPVTGQLYGGKSTINLEALLAAKPQIIIDLGDFKKGVADDLNALQEQVGIPVVFIQADLEHMAEGFRTLGSLLSGKKDRCEELASYVEETLSIAAEGREKIPEADRLSVMYTTGASGLGTNAEGSSQAQVIPLVGAVNAIVVEDVTSKGGGNVINMEQLYAFDPDIILFSADSIYGDVAGDASWQQLRAIQEGRYYEIPDQPYNWMSSPPSLNMLLGIRWLGSLLYPEVYTYDMAEEAQRAYKLLWGYDLSPEEAAELLARSTGKAGN